MFKSSVFLCCLYLCALTPYLTYAMTDEQRAQIRAQFETVGESCNKGSNIITADDLSDLRAKKVPTGPNAPCFMACMMKQIGLAMTDEQRAQIRAQFETVGESCNKGSNIITADDLSDLRAKKVPTGPNAPCFMACMMKQIGLMDDNGMLQKETLLEMAKAMFEDPEELKLIEDYLRYCSHINDESVSDGAAGCERAMLAYKCMTDNASQFGFEI